MKVRDIRILKKPLVLAGADEIDALEAKLWVTFPAGYREYVTKLGEGVLGGAFVRIYPPWRIEKDLLEWRKRIGKHWFWEKSRKLLPKERALECVIIGDTVNGDELIFHPVRPNQLFILPRDSEKASVAGADLLEAVERMCSSGELTEPFAERDFEPYDSRKEKRRAAKEEVADPEGESLAEIVSMGMAWAKRRKALNSARKDLRTYGGGKDRKTTLRYEALILDGKYPNQPGYLAVFQVDDKTSGREIGTFLWRMPDDSHGSEYWPNHANLGKIE